MTETTEKIILWGGVAILAYLVYQKLVGAASAAGAAIGSAAEAVAAAPSQAVDAATKALTGEPTLGGEVYNLFNPSAVNTPLATTQPSQVNFGVTDTSGTWDSN